MILAVAQDPEADTAIDALKAFRDRLIRKQGGANNPLRVFALPFELMV